MSIPSDDRRGHQRTPPSQEVLLAALHDIRAGANAALLHLSQIASTGELGQQQNDHQRAPPCMPCSRSFVWSSIRLARRRTGRRAVAAREHWNALEHSDPLDDRFQDAPVMLDDRQGRDDQMIS
ncbi:MAG: hypothetical protein HND48_06750 [Chloroflexi bacterium]|nr:hypothetical protein [Chloroflexota bacterium]